MAEPKPKMFKQVTVCNACPKLMDCIYDGTVVEWFDPEYTFARKSYIYGLEETRYGPKDDKYAMCPYLEEE
jgi:hypothetical protein